MRDNVLLRIGFTFMISVAILLTIWNLFSSSSSSIVCSSCTVSSGYSDISVYYSKAMSIDLELTNAEPANISLEVFFLNQTALESLSTAGEISMAELKEYGRSYTFYERKISIDIPCDVFAIVLHNPNAFGISVTLTQKSYGLRPLYLAPILVFLILSFLLILVSIYQTLTERHRSKTLTKYG